MAFLRFTTDRAIKRLRWVMVGATLFDKFNTLLGQPATYWQHPNTADEINQSWHYSLSRGLPFYLLDSFVTIAMLFLIVSLIPKKIGLIVMSIAILNHYFGASFWLCYHWNFGVGGPLIYGIILSVVLVLWVFATKPEKPLSNEPDAQRIASADGGSPPRPFRGPAARRR